MFILKKLDDGRVVKGELSYLTHHEVISVANQFLRNGSKQDKETYHFLMKYQHDKYHKDLPQTAA